MEGGNGRRRSGEVERKWGNDRCWSLKEWDIKKRGNNGRGSGKGERDNDRKG